MFAAFKNRKPWATALVALFLGPVIGMCYLNRGRLAAFYFLMSLLFLCFTVVAIKRGFLPFSYDDAPLIVVQILDIIGAVHCVWIAKTQSFGASANWYSRWYILLGFLVIGSGLALSVGKIEYSFFHIPSVSMSPNINKGEYIVVQKFAYKTAPPIRGDVITFDVRGQNYVKRVVGVPGDTIQIRDSVLFINGSPTLRQPFEHTRLPNLPRKDDLHSFTETLPDGKSYKILSGPPSPALDNTPLYTVPADSYFVLGDNRDQAEDSRNQNKIGFILRKNVIGKVSRVIGTDTTKIWDLHPIDER
jgi:signal peptidase I